MRLIVAILLVALLPAAGHADRLKTASDLAAIEYLVKQCGEAGLDNELREARVAAIRDDVGSIAAVEARLLLRAENEYGKTVVCDGLKARRTSKRPGR